MSETRYFVTGGAGFIGSHLVNKLVGSGPVTIYDNLSVGKPEFIKASLASGRARLIQGDLLDVEKLTRAVDEHDIVFHLAANPEARRGIENTRLDLQQETVATYNLLEAMRIHNIENIVFASSGTVYGEVPPIPVPENYGPELPISLYGAGKLASEGLISAFCGTFGMQAWIYRFANIVGSRATHGVITDFIRKLAQDQSVLEILGDGCQRKPYLHIEDCIEGLFFGICHAREKVNVFNLGCTSTTDVHTIAMILTEEMGLTETRLVYSGGERGWPGDVPLFRCDTTKMSKLGWTARYTSDEAVRKAVQDILQWEACLCR